MTTPITFALSMIDGQVCIACTQTDWNEPRLVVNHWPTTIRLRDILDYFGCDESQLSNCVVTQSRPGEYYVRNPGRSGPVGAYLCLSSGANTKPVKTDLLDYPKPRTTKRTEYRDGRWWKCMAKGWQQV